MYSNHHWTKKLNNTQLLEARVGGDHQSGSQDAKSFPTLSTCSSSQFDSQSTLPKYEEVLATTRYREIIERFSVVEKSVANTNKSIATCEGKITSKLEQLNQKYLQQIEQLQHELRNIAIKLENYENKKKFHDSNSRESTSKRERSPSCSDEDNDHGLGVNEFLCKRACGIGARNSFISNTKAGYSEEFEVNLFDRNL